MMWIILAILIILLAYLNTKKPKNYPPGPKWYPIVGSALKLNKLHKKYGSLSKASMELALQYGPLVGLKVGYKNVVLVNGYKAMHELFTREEFNGKPDDISTRSRTWGERMGLFFIDSDVLKEQKSFVLQQLRKCGFNKQVLSNNLETETNEIIRDITKKIQNDSVVRIDDLFDPHIAQTAWRLLSGHRGTLSPTEMEEFLDAMRDYSEKIFVTGDLFNYMPFLIYICPDFCGYNKYMSVHHKLNNFTEKKIETLMRTYDPKNPYGFVDEYQNMLSSSEKKLGSTYKQLVALCVDLQIGGYETTVSMSNFAFLYLLLNPEVQKKAQEEIDRVVGRDRLPTLDDRSRLPYVEGMVLETLRLDFGRSVIGLRRVLTDTTFNGHSIAKDTILLGNYRGVFFSEDAGFEDPKAFKPERYIKDGRIVVPETLIPFGFGKRRCVAEIFGRSIIFLFLACTLHQFNFEALPNDPPSMDFIEGFVPVVKPFKAIVTPRN